MSGFADEAIAWATNFLTQILVIIGGIVAGTKYILVELRKGNERLGKKILGPEQDAKIGKGGLLDELRQELKEEFQRDLENLETKLTQMINDSHNQLINEFRRTSTKISYMARDLGKVERSLERMSSGRYTAAKEETTREQNEFYDTDDIIGDGDVFNGNDMFDTNKFNKKQRGHESK